MCSTFLGKEAENEEDVERKETEGILGNIICLAQFLIIAVFVAYPLCYTAYLSMSEYDFMYDLTPSFVGIKNYVSLFSDPDFLVSMKNTAVFASLDFILLMVLSLIIALLIFFCKKEQVFSGLLYLLLL